MSTEAIVTVEPEPMTPNALLDASLARVESASIREWATGPRNRPVFVQLAERAIANKGTSADPHMFAAYIICLAIGA